MANVFYLASNNKYVVNGLNLENFIFKLSGAGICLKNVKRKKQTLTFVSSAANNNAIISSAQECGLSIKLLGQTGLINFLKKLPYKIGALLGIIYSIVCIIYLSNIVSVVEYIIPQNHTCLNNQNCVYNQQNLSQIKSFIDQHIQLGKHFSTDTRMLQNKVMANFELVENCIIKKVGYKVSIEIVEAILKTPGSQKQIVASNNCIIHSITTYSGKPLVKAGDVVTKGQVLVESDGDILPKANIVAKVWYTGMAIHNCYVPVLEETGNVLETTAIQIFDKTILKPKQCNFQMYSTKIKQSYITNTLLPISKITYTYCELQTTEKYVSFEDVKQSVMAQSKENALKQTTGSPLECTYSIVKHSDMVRVDCFLLVEEQMGILN